MDFGTLLSVAQKNENNKQPIACYETKFAPPKKQSKQTRTLSENIKKFLARREEEERRKALEEKKKRENLLALRDHKAQSRINKHLKVCKAANKSVLADAIDNDNTAVTIAGPSQPDEDDYGYVSQEASAFYNQLMNKYSNVPAQKPLFSNSGKKTIKDIASTKDRVKQALKQQEVEEALGHRRKRKSSALSSKDGGQGDSDDRSEKDVTEDKSGSQEKEDKPRPKKKPMPPPINFGELLKIAEKKQHEPVMIEAKPKNEEPERLMTKRQMREYAKEKEWRERKEQRERNGDTSYSGSTNGQSAATPTTANKNSTPASLPGKSSKPQIGKIPKTSESKTTQGSSVPGKSSSRPATVTTPAKKTAEKSNEKLPSSKSIPSKSSERDTLLEERKKLEAEKRKLEEMRQAIEEEKRKLALSKSKREEAKTAEKSLPAKAKTIEKSGAPTRDPKPRQIPTTTNAKPRIPPVANGKPKQFPPPDLKPLRPRPALSKDGRRPQISNKRRICDDDDEDEHDPELDDFIDDGSEEESEDYSKYISEIFGYDKSKYRNVDFEDDGAMESSFAQQLKEEYVSTKIGIMEDLEDIRMEALEKKRKALLKKKMKK